MAIPDIAISVGVRDLTKAGVDSAGKSLGRLGKVGGAALNALKVGAIGAGVAVAGLGVAGVREFGNFLERADGLDKMSQRLGISVEELSKLSFAAEQSGSDLGTLETGLNRFARVIDDANSGSALAIETLDKLGLSAEELAAATPEQRLLALADAMQQNVEPGDRLNLAQEALGRSGAQLIPLLQGGTTALDDFAAQAEATGNVMSTQTATAGAMFNDSWNTVKNSISGVFLTIASGLLPVLQNVVDFLQSTIVPAIRGFIGSLTGSDGLQGATEGVASSFIDKLKPALDVVGSVFNDYLKPVLDVFWRLLQDVVLPIVAIFGQGLVEHIVMTWQNNLKPALDSLIALVQQLEPVFAVVLQVVGAALTLFRDLVAERIGFIINLARGLIDFLTAIFQGEWDQAWQAILFILESAWQAITGTVQAALDFLQEIFGIFGIDLEETMRTAVDNVVGFFTSMPERLAGVGKAIANAIITAVNAGTQVINRIIPDKISIPLAPDIDLPDNPIPRIPLLQQGGIVTRPTLAVIGEAGPEAVIPLRGGAAAGALGGNRIVNLNLNLDGATFYGLDDFEDEVTAIAAAASRNGLLR